MNITLSTEKDAARQFDDAAIPLRRLTQEFPGSGLATFANSFLDGLAISIEAEKFARQAERCNVLKIQADRAKFCQEKFSGLNSRAVEAFTRSRDSLKLFRQDLTGYLEKAGPKIKQFGDEKLEQFRTELNEVLVDAEFKKSDLEQIDKEVRGLMDFAKSKGFANLPDYLEERTSRAIKMRQSPGRGAEENISPWCIAAALAILIALGLIFFIHCGIFGCSIATSSAYIAAMIVVVLAGVGC
jgi:hypothetical protein